MDEQWRPVMVRNEDIKEHMEVIGNDGEHVGIVDGIDPDGEIKLSRTDAPDRLHHFDHPGHSCCGRRVTDVGFDGPQPQWPIRRPLNLNRTAACRCLYIRQRQEKCARAGDALLGKLRHCRPGPRTAAI